MGMSSSYLHFNYVAHVYAWPCHVETAYLSSVLFIADDLEHADDMCQNPRTYKITVGPRKSLNEASYRLKDFKKAEELVSAQKVSQTNL